MIQDQNVAGVSGSLDQQLSSKPLTPVASEVRRHGALSREAINVANRLWDVINKVQGNIEGKGSPNPNGPASIPLPEPVGIAGLMQDSNTRLEDAFQRISTGIETLDTYL